MMAVSAAGQFSHADLEDHSLSWLSFRPPLTPRTPSFRSELMAEYMCDGYEEQQAEGLDIGRFCDSTVRARYLQPWQFRAFSA